MSTFPKVILIFALIGTVIAASYAALPSMIKMLALHKLQGAEHIGLHGLTLPSPQIGIDYIRFENVALDREEINTLRALTFTFTLHNLLQGRFDRVIIEGAEIIASSNDNGSLALDGWLQNQGVQRALNLPIQSISLRDCELTLLTATYGGITARLNATAQARSKQDPNKDRLYEFDAAFQSQQRYLTLNGKASGSLSAQFINGSLDFERGKISVPDYAITMARLSGSGQMAYSPAGLSLSVELRAGGMRLSALPWQNAAMTYKVENNAPEFFLSASSVGVNGLELSMSKKADNPAYTRIFAPTQDMWDSYIKINRIEGEDLDNLVVLLAQLNTEIELE